MKSPRRRRGLAFGLVLASCAAAGGCGAAAAWYVGLFTSNGRFDGLDACALFPPEKDVAVLVRNPAREPVDSRPKPLLGGWSGGNLRSECKWSSVPKGRDEPFRTVRVHTETMKRSGRTSAEERARLSLESWYRARAARRDTDARPIGVGEQGYANTDTMRADLVFLRVTVYDLHVKFRVSNGLIDVSARTHSRPSTKEWDLLVDLARKVEANVRSS